jgi:hypothetical protein
MHVCCAHRLSCKLLLWYGPYSTLPCLFGVRVLLVSPLHLIDGSWCSQPNKLGRSNTIQFQRIHGFQCSEWPRPWQISSQPEDNSDWYLCISCGLRVTAPSHWLVRNTSIAFKVPFRLQSPPHTGHHPVFWNAGFRSGQTDGARLNCHSGWRKDGFLIRDETADPEDEGGAGKGEESERARGGKVTNRGKNIKMMKRIIVVEKKSRTLGWKEEEEIYSQVI